MLKELFDAIRSDAKAEKITANGLDYVKQDDCYVLAEDPEINKLKNELSKKRRVIDNELSIAKTNEEISEASQRLESMKVLNPLKLESDKLQAELANIQLQSKIDNKDLALEKMRLSSQLEVENAKNDLINLKPTRKETFTSITSFVEFILHESVNHNSTGNGYFIMLNSSGGKFYNNFDRIKDIFSFQRQFSEVYHRLNRARQERTFDQKELLEFLLENKHYITDFPTVFNSFKRVKNTKTSRFETEPMLTDNSAETFEVVQSWEFNGEVKKEKITLIPEIELTIPVTKMGVVKYKVNIYITPIKGREGEILFDLYAPGIEYVLQTALNDELELAKDQLKDLVDAYIASEI